MKVLCWSSALAEVPYEFGAVRPFVHSQHKMSEMAHHVFSVFYMKLKSCKELKSCKVAEPDFF